MHHPRRDVATSKYRHVDAEPKPAASRFWRAVRVWRAARYRLPLRHFIGGFAIRVPWARSLRAGRRWLAPLLRALVSACASRPRWSDSCTMPMSPSQPEICGTANSCQSCNAGRTSAVVCRGRKAPRPQRLSASYRRARAFSARFVAAPPANRRSIDQIHSPAYRTRAPEAIRPDFGKTNSKYLVSSTGWGKRQRANRWRERHEKE
jgi:hypothetical protein